MERLLKRRASELCLPVDDSDPDERRALLDAARDRYRYTYSKANLRGVAMLEALPDEEKQRTAWTGALLGDLRAILGNAQTLNTERGGGFLRSVAQTLKKVEETGVEEALQVLSEIITGGQTRGAPSRFGAYSELHRAWRLCPSATECLLDSTFARLRVAGYNPAWIRRVDPREGLPEDFGVTEEHYRVSAAGPDRLEAALAEGRLFLASYRQLLGRRAGCHPVPPEIDVDYADDPEAWDAAYRAREAAYAHGPQAKQVVAPLALFALPLGGGSLRPVAIQLFPDGHGGRAHRVFTPRDGLAWQAAKLCVNAADANVHEAIAHLGTTHLVQEAFALALHNCLSRSHPIFHLLAPHFEGTFLINSAADSELVRPGGGVDVLLSPTIGEVIDVSAQALRAYDFNAELFPEQLRRRGVDDASMLRDYPYRDDGLLVWEAIEGWVGGYVRRFYPDDAAVVGDRELQDFVRQVGLYRDEDASGRRVGGGIRGVGEAGGGVVSRDYLIAMISQIIWNGSAQHAAVNFPQGNEMSYAPLAPLALMGALPTEPGYTEDELLRLLPVSEVAHYQLVVGKLLGTLCHTRLGWYPEGRLGRSYFGDGELVALAEGFRARLDEVEATIDDRNLERPCYRYLRPSEIPQSINI